MCELSGAGLCRVGERAPPEGPSGGAAGPPGDMPAGPPGRKLTPGPVGGMLPTRAGGGVGIAGGALFGRGMAGQPVCSP